jgi:hypothetical protein
MDDGRLVEQARAAAFGELVERHRAVYEDRSISVDARATIVDGLIRVNVTVRSQEPQNAWVPVQDAAPKSDPILNWTNSFALLLSSGKPMVALETMDALTSGRCLSK